MRTSRSALVVPPVCLAVLAGLSAGPAAAQGETAAIPPVERAERHFEAGAAYLRALPNGTKVTIQRADGTAFVLRQQAGRLATELPAAKLSPDRRTVTTPLGYRLYVKPAEGMVPDTLLIEAPNGAWSQFVLLSPDPHAYVMTKGQQVWSRPMPGTFVLRLPDGTRVDTTDGGRKWEALTLRGERMRLEFEKKEWTALPTLPSPPLIPDPEALFVTRNGETWRQNEREDHVVFAWNWYPVGFTPGDAVEDVRARRRKLDEFFVGLALPQDPFETAGYLLARRLALSGGDRVTFEVPGSKPAPVFLLPDSIDPESLPLKVELKLNNRIGAPGPRR